MQTPEALRIIGEKLRQMGALDVIGMLSQDPPHITYSPEMDRHVGAPAPGANGACPGRYVVPASTAVRTEAVLLQQNQTCRGPVGAPAPGANGCLPKTLICARFVRGSHRGGAPTTKPNPASEPVGAPAPGANGACPRRKSVPASSAVRTEAVLLQQNQKLPRTRRSTRPGCEWGLPGVLICAGSGSHRGGAPTTKPKAAPNP